MTAVPVAADGVTRFVTDLEEEGHRPAVHGDVVRYHVVPVAGAQAGQEVITGVGTSELQAWPMAPPHWIHLGEGVALSSSTNTDTQLCPPGWRRHSFDTGAWVLNRKPIHLWVAHVRGVLSLAI